ECGFDPSAVRRGAWPDVSAGYSQMTVQTAGAYGIGDGTADPANVTAVLTALQDRETGIRLAAAHYATCLGVVDRQFPGVAGDEAGEATGPIAYLPPDFLAAAQLGAARIRTWAGQARVIGVQRTAGGPPEPDLGTGQQLKDDLADWGKPDEDVMREKGVSQL